MQKLPVYEHSTEWAGFAILFLCMLDADFIQRIANKSKAMSFLFALAAVIVKITIQEMHGCDTIGMQTIGNGLQ